MFCNSALLVGRNIAICQSQNTGKTFQRDSVGARTSFKCPDSVLPLKWFCSATLRSKLSERSANPSPRCESLTAMTKYLEQTSFF